MGGADLFRTSVAQPIKDMITKKRNYKMFVFKDGNDDEVSIDDYLRDIFDSYYSDFLLNFGMEQLINSLDD